MPTFTGIVALPPSRNVPTFNSPNYNQASQSLTYGDAVKSFLTFPQAQGKEQLLDTDVSGLLQCFGDISIIGTGNYIEFPDTTKQTTAFVEANYAQLNEDNIFLSPQINTFQGNSNPNGTTAPFRIGGANGEYASLYVDSSPTFDATLYSNQTGGGLTLRNVEGNSFTMTPSAPNNTALFSNPISCGTFSLNAGAITGTQLTLNNGVQTSVLTTTANGLNVADPIVSTGNITGNSLGISTIGNDTYTIDSRSSQNFGLTVVNSTGGNAQISLSNGGSKVASITCTDGNLLDFNGASIALNGIGSQAISCTTLNTNGNTITSGALNAGAISGSGLITTGNITTASNGLGGTSVFNDTQCNFNNISCGGNIDTSSLSSTGALSGTQLTLSNGGNTSLLTTDSVGLNINDALTVNSINTSGVLTSTGSLIMDGSAKLASGANQNGNSILASNQGLYITRNMTNSLAEYDIVALNTTTLTGLNIYCSQSDVGPSTSPEISITNTRTTINADLFVNPSNTLYVNTIIPANTGPIQMAGGTFLASTPSPSSNDTTIATTQFVNTAISSIPSGGLIQSGKQAGGWVNAVPNQGPNSPMYISGYFQMLTYTTINLPTPYQNTNYTAIACLSDLNNPSYSSGGTQWMGGIWHSTSINSPSQFNVYVFCSWRGSNSGVGNSLPSYNISWITYP